MREVIVQVLPKEDAPIADHDDQFYCHREVVKHKGKRKKTDPIEYSLTYIPWNDINDTELLSLAMHEQTPGSREEMGRWRVLCRGVHRPELIGVITGAVDSRDLPANPTHQARDKLSKLMHSNWKYIHSQIKCSTFCWECSDAKVMECILENADMLRGEGI